MENSNKMHTICFDLEGPLSPQDNAYELMKLFPGGDRVFETISRYDDLVTLEGREGYEPGDTLALIIPFLAYHGIEERQIVAMGQETELTPGALGLISRLKLLGWQIFCISSSYEQYAFHVTERLGIPSQNVVCTRFPLDHIRQSLSEKDHSLFRQAEEQFVTLSGDTTIKETMDAFYWQTLPRTSLGKIISSVKPVGGKRKVEALEQFTTRTGKPISQWVAVGDSITDSKMLRTVNKAGGLAIAFNANEYALPYSTMSLASSSLDDLWIALEVWEKGGRRAAELTVKERESKGGDGNRAWFHWLAGNADTSRALEVHRRIRHLVRAEAAKLG